VELFRRGYLVIYGGDGAYFLAGGKEELMEYSRLGGLWVRKQRTA
jgi:hypothetical protein